MFKITRECVQTAITYTQISGLKPPICFILAGLGFKTLNEVI